MNPYWKSDLKHMNVWKRLAIIIVVLSLIRFVSGIPVPYINPEYLDAMKDSVLANGLIGMMTGSSFSHMSIFALSVSPYITASIVIQLLSVAIPTLGNLPKEGKVGEEKYKRITNLFGLALGCTQSVLMTYSFGRRGIFYPYTPKTALLCAGTWSMGVLILIIVSNFLDNFALGQGMSWLLLSNIMSTIPAEVQNFYKEIMIAESWKRQLLYGTAFITAFLILIFSCTVLTTSERHLPVMYSGKLSGTISEARSVFVIPLITCSVMPLIFAGSVSSVPAVVMQLAGRRSGTVAAYFTPQMWFRPDKPWYTLGAFIYIALTYVFTLFYLEISFNAFEIATKLKESGGVVQDLRPGLTTAKYLQRIIRNTAILGNSWLTGLVIIMYAVSNLSGLHALSMGSTSAIISVALINDVLRRIRGESVQFKSIPSLAVVHPLRGMTVRKIGSYIILSQNAMWRTFLIVVGTIFGSGILIYLLDMLSRLIVVHH